MRLLGRRGDGRAAREEARREQDIFTASQNFDFLADMPSDIFEQELEQERRDGEQQYSRQTSHGLSGRVLEVFPGARSVHRKYKLYPRPPGLSGGRP